MSKKILCISDLHVGSMTSVMPEEFIESRADGSPFYHQANDIQLDMFNFWKKMCKTVGRVDAVFNLGDTIDGPNRKKSGLGVWTSNLRTQAQAAAKLLGMIKSRKYYTAIGNDYHVWGGMSAEEIVADYLSVSKNAVCEARHGLYVKLGGKIFHLMHRVGTSRNWLYRSTPLTREMLFSALMDDMFEEHDGGVNCILRGHAHYFWCCDTGSHIGFVCPGWKLSDEFLKGLSISMDNVSIGAFVLRIKNSGQIIHDKPIKKKYMLDREVINVE